MLLNEIVEYNKEFVDEFEGSKLSHIPQKKLAIVACMDTRLTDGFFRKSYGYKSW